jgi:hypothetical protein
MRRRIAAVAATAAAAAGVWVVLVATGTDKDPMAGRHTFTATRGSIREGLRRQTKLSRHALLELFKKKKKNMGRNAGSTAVSGFTSIRRVTDA